MVGTYILIFGRVESNKRNSRLEVRIKNMVLLGEALERFCKSVSLYIDLENLDDSLVKDIHKAMKANPGDCEVKLRVKDPEEGYLLEMYPKKFRVSPSGFVRIISTIEHINFRMNGFQGNS